MLWIALNFQCLPLESLLQTPTQSEPWAITDGRNVTVCNPHARNAGVCPGMTLPAACALVPNLNYRQRDPETEAAALDRLAIWAGRYTPSVSLQPPSGLLLEVEGSLALLGGIKRILESIRRDLAEMGYTCVPGCAPTASAAWLLARGGGKKIVPCKRMIAPEISPLPIAVLDCSHKTLETLRAVGVKSIGGLLKLPRDGVARRFGQNLLDQIDRALGKLPEARRFHIPPASFTAEIELGAEVTHTEALLFAAKRLLIQMCFQEHLLDMLNFY